MKSKITLVDAFNLGNRAELVAFVGAGGKSSLMLALAQELIGRVVITTTTRMFEGQVAAAAASLSGIICRYPDITPLENENASNVFFLIAGQQDGDKVSGVPLDLPAQLLDRADIDTVLVEADGAKMLPVKAPAAHEPALPSMTTLVVPMLGIDAIGQKIGTVAHRAQLVANLLGKTVYERLTAEDLAKLLANHGGGLKGIPINARIIPVINKVETPEQLDAARHIAQLVLDEPRIEQVVISQALSESPVIEVHKRVTAVILAAGQSKRMGDLKQQLPWGKTSILGQTIRNLQESAVYDSLVVTGYKASTIAALATAEGVPTVTNARYAEGEMLSSLQTAVTHLERNRAAVLVMLADQPMINPQTIDKLLAAYWQGIGDIIAPLYDGKRGNPVIIDRRHFDELLTLPAGAAPRDLLNRHEVYLLAVQSPSVLQDIDKPEDYQRYKPHST